MTRNSVGRIGGRTHRSTMTETAPLAPTAHNENPAAVDLLERASKANRTLFCRRHRCNTMLPACHDQHDKPARYLRYARMSEREASVGQNRSKPSVGFSRRKFSPLSLLRRLGMGFYDWREEKFAGEYPPFCASPRVSGWMPHAIRSLISLIVFSHLILVVSATSTSAAGTSRPMLAVRADHMVLDLVVYRDQLLVGTQSGRRLRSHDRRPSTAALRRYRRCR